jgi:hypothetical protein
VAATDESSVGEEVADVREAGDVVDLVEEDQGEDFADAWDGEEPVIGVAVVDFGVLVETQLELANLGIVGVDESEVGLDAAFDGRIGEVVGDAELFAIASVGELFGEGWKVVLAGLILDVGDEKSALADQEATSAEQVAGLTHASGIDVGLGEVATAEESGDLVGVDLVVLGLAAVDGFHVQSVSQDEGDLLVFAEVGQPVPGEHTLGGDDQPVAVGLDGLQEELGVGAEIFVDDDIVVLVEDADVHGSGVEIDAGVVSMVGVFVETHQEPPLGWDRS